MHLYVEPDLETREIHLKHHDAKFRIERLRRGYCVHIRCPVCGEEGLHYGTIPYSAKEKGFPPEKVEDINDSIFRIPFDDPFFKQFIVCKLDGNILCRRTGEDE